MKSASNQMVHFSFCAGKRPSQLQRTIRLFDFKWLQFEAEDLGAFPVNI